MTISYSFPHNAPVTLADELAVFGACASLGRTYNFERSMMTLEESLRLMMRQSQRVNYVGADLGLWFKVRIRCAKRNKLIAAMKD